MTDLTESMIRIITDRLPFHNVPTNFRIILGKRPKQKSTQPDSPTQIPGFDSQTGTIHNM